MCASAILLPIAFGVVTALSLSGCRARGHQRAACQDTGTPLRTVCGFHNPEDVEYVARAGIVLVTNMRDRGMPQEAGRAEVNGDVQGRDTGKHGGFIAAYDPVGGAVRVIWPLDGDTAGAAERTLGDPTCTTPPAADVFSPHGMTSTTRDGRTLVFVTNHAPTKRGRESIEIFELRGSGASAQLLWKACIPTPDAIQANDVAVTSDARVVVSNYQPSNSLRFTFEASLFGTKTGDILVWSPESGWRHVEGTSASLPNGVAASPDGSMLFYTESMTGLVHRRPLDDGAGAIAVEVEGNPDNLSWTEHGRLLVASHTAGTRFGLCLLGRRPCTTSWAVFEIDPLTLAVHKIFDHDGAVLGAVSSAAQVGDELVLGSVFDDRIGVLALNTAHAAR